MSWDSGFDTKAWVERFSDKKPEPAAKPDKRRIRVTYRAGDISFECKVANVERAFELISKLQSVFDVQECGCCNGVRLKFEVRDKDGVKFYSLRCNDCGAVADFGKRKDGSGLWLKRDKGENGWYVYQKEVAKEVEKEMKDERL